MKENECEHLNKEFLNYFNNKAVYKCSDCGKLLEPRPINEYDKYLMKHIGGVKKSWNEILYPYLLDNSNLTVEELNTIINSIDKHDLSKYTDEEFIPYYNYFYVSNKDKKYINDFDLAWLHHQHCNPHHWQYWTLIRDGGNTVPLDIPFNYICEMLCDWSSFQYYQPGSNANSWYDSNMYKMILSKNTRKQIESILNSCKNL